MQTLTLLIMGSQNMQKLKTLMAIAKNTNGSEKESVSHDSKHFKVKITY